MGPALPPWCDSTRSTVVSYTCSDRPTKTALWPSNKLRNEGSYVYLGKCIVTVRRLRYNARSCLFWWERAPAHAGHLMYVMSGSARLPVRRHRIPSSTMSLPITARSLEAQGTTLLSFARLYYPLHDV